MSRPTPHRLNRRTALKGFAATLALLSSTSLTSSIMAQEAQAVPFSFDNFTARLRDVAAAPYVAPHAALPEIYQGLDYDNYRKIQFRADRAKWLGDAAGYQIQGFHPGWLFPQPIQLFTIENGLASPLDFSSADFDYHDETIRAGSAEVAFPGLAGFRLNYPLNGPGNTDELISFLGASYFRALGRDNIYGLSARGLVLNSWVDGPEEFPRFSEFYLERPTAPGPITIYAALESESVAGAYRFVLTPASQTVQETFIEVTARLFFRADIKELGIAPLTSMFLFADTNRAGFDDYRAQVHDSNALLVERESGEVLWRALNNTTDLGNSYLWENNPRAFGLYQRGRTFADYQDAGAHYERRPTARIEPIGDWGQGNVRLIEIPAKLEADDNIGAFWVPIEPVKAGDAREFSYRIVWGDLNPDPKGPLAHVVDSRAGLGGVSGVAGSETVRKFVIDFGGGPLADWDDIMPPDILATVSGGHIATSTVSQIPANGLWRLVLDVERDGTTPLEIKAYLVGHGRQLTETWLYQWRPVA